jgi:hypothetical protein
MIRSLSLLFFLSGCATHQPWVSPLALSYHADRAAGYNETHEGVTVGASISDQLSWSVGRIINSERNWSTFAAVQYDPIDLGRVKLGVQAGLVTGYRVAEVLPVILPSASVRVSKHHSLQIVAAPVDGGVIAAQWRIE